VPDRAYLPTLVPLVRAAPVVGRTMVERADHRWAIPMDGERAARTGAEELIAELWAADPPDLLQIARQDPGHGGH